MTVVFVGSKGMCVRPGSGRGHPRAGLWGGARGLSGLLQVTQHFGIHSPGIHPNATFHTGKQSPEGLVDALKAPSTLGQIRVSVPGGLCTAQGSPLLALFRRYPLPGSMLPWRASRPCTGPGGKGYRPLQCRPGAGV